MATNVTEKDKTLQEIIDWCEQLEIDGLRLANALLMQRVHGGYAITLKGLLAVKVWRLHLFLFHHGEHKYFRRKK